MIYLTICMNNTNIKQKWKLKIDSENQEKVTHQVSNVFDQLIDDYE